MHSVAQIVLVLCASGIISVASAQSLDHFIDAELFDPNYLQHGADVSEMIELRTRLHFYTEVYDHIYVRRILKWNGTFLKISISKRLKDAH